ncbi:MAG: hypothetical protein HY290_16845 [Planctomycetia bacterium]|nr:hypothetical protein [Planctomycetia bacterium]
MSKVETSWIHRFGGLKGKVATYETRIDAELILIRVQSMFHPWLILNCRRQIQRVIADSATQEKSMADFERTGTSTTAGSRRVSL